MKKALLINNMYFAFQYDLLDSETKIYSRTLFTYNSIKDIIIRQGDSFSIEHLDLLKTLI